MDNYAALPGRTHEVEDESFSDRKYFESSVIMMRSGALG